MIRYSHYIGPDRLSTNHAEYYSIQRDGQSGPDHILSILVVLWEDKMSNATHCVELFLLETGEAFN